MSCGPKLRCISGLLAFAVRFPPPPFLLMKVLQAVAPTDAASHIVKTAGKTLTRAPGAVTGFLKGAFLPVSKGGNDGGQPPTSPGNGGGGRPGPGTPPGGRAGAGDSSRGSLLSRMPGSNAAQAVEWPHARVLTSGYLAGQALGRTASAVSRGRAEAKRPNGSAGSVLKAAASGALMNSRVVPQSSPYGSSTPGGVNPLKDSAGRMRDGLKILADAETREWEEDLVMGTRFPPLFKYSMLKRFTFGILAAYALTVSALLLLNRPTVCHPTSG